MGHLFLIDRDNTINLSSDDNTSPLFHILTKESLILKPNVEKAFALLKSHGIPSLLVTRQRCLVKELITKKELDDLHSHLEFLLSYKFLDIFIEPSAFTKMNLYEKISVKYKDYKLSLFDDSKEERDIANNFNIKTYDGTDLYKSVCSFLKINE